MATHQGDARWRESEPALVEVIRDEILAASERRITFARFMERAATEPGLGYYATSGSRPTREGDFLTAPELHPFFGRIVARQLDELWRRLGSPERFVLREYGAGRGTLAETVQAGLRADASGLARALAHEPVDLGTSAPADPVVGCILANEFLDALPVHRVDQTAAGLREVYVTWGDGWFEDDAAAPSTPALERRLAADGVALAPGTRTEVCLALDEWVESAARSLERGYLLVIDYGHEAGDLYAPRRAAGTLLGYRSHRTEADPYLAVGRMDLTAHVDLTALDRAAAHAGLEPAGATTQAEFVAGLGLGDMLRALGEDPAMGHQPYADARASVARLLDPRHLGGFAVRAWARDAPVDPPLAGFAFRLARR